MDIKIEGNELFPGTDSYRRANNLYASSTYGKERNMNPAEIFQPSSIEDIQIVVKGAIKSKIPIAIRTGGHQYSGASSTDPHGIQLDLKPTFRRPNIDLHLKRENGKVYLVSSVSWTLSEIFDFLKDNGVFMPTGQCSTVCLGGHVQTGGYGMLARSFGLLGDYVREIQIVDYQAEVVKVTKDSQPDLFYGLLGGSPGNLGVVTHVKIEVQDDNKYKGSKGLWKAFRYEKKTLNTLLDIFVKKGEDTSLPRGYDFTVNVVSEKYNLLDAYPGTEDELKAELPDDLCGGPDSIDPRQFPCPLIIVYAQWVNFGQNPYSPDLFDEINKLPSVIAGKESFDEPMSTIASWWLFDGPREFPYPYVKRTNSTRSSELSQSGWSDWFSGRLDEIVKPDDNGLWVSSQLQIYGGKESMFSNNAKNDTAYCFRDATFGGTWDVFYKDRREAAETWQAENDRGAVKHFSPEDRRVLWGSYGDWDMKKVWKFYYDPDTYRKMQEIRKRYDPLGTFTANPFCVEALK